MDQEKTAKMPKQRRSQEDRSAEMRTKILSAATRILSDRGYSAATIKTIAEEAGVSIGALQHQFSTKAKLMAKVIDQIFDARKLVYRRAIHNSPAQSGIATVTWGAWEAAKQPEFLAIMEVALARRSDPELLEATQRSFERMEAVLERWTMHIWKTYDVRPEIAAIGRRMTSAFMTGLTLREAGGLDTNVTELVSYWSRILSLFVEHPSLQEFLGTE